MAAIYSKPNSKKKSALLDHINETYNLLNSKYRDGLFFLIMGDTNDLKLDSILNLSPNLKQVVKDVTRLNPPRILDPIITNLTLYYQSPTCLPPLDPDPDCDGKPSDHMMVEMRPIDTVNNKCARTKRKVTFRPLPQSGLDLMGDWI